MASSPLLEEGRGRRGQRCERDRIPAASLASTGFGAPARAVDRGAKPRPSGSRQFTHYCVYRRAYGKATGYVQANVDLGWLERRRDRPHLSCWAQEGVRFALLLEHLPLSVPEVAQLAGWNERRVRRRLARARAELEAPERACACGCGRALPAAATARRRYVDDTCKDRAYRRRRRSVALGKFWRKNETRGAA
jgi:hypothetical protein